MPELFTVVGIAGSGKTEMAMSILEQKLKAGIPWHQIGFASFSRSACLEAAERSSVITGVDVGRLQKDGFYRTIHSSALRLLGLSAKLIIDPDSAEGRKWFEEALGAPRGGEPGTLSAKIDEALTWWDVQRARLAFLPDADGNGYYPDDQPPPSPVDPLGQPIFLGTPDPPSDRCPPSENAPMLAQPEFQCFTTDFNELDTSSRDVKCPISTIGTETDILKLKLLFDSTGKTPEMSSRVAHSVKSPRIPYRDKEKPGTASVGGHRQQVAQNCRGWPGNTQRSDTNVGLAKHGDIVKLYEDSKRSSGRLDFTDILFRYSGVEIDAGLMFRDGYPQGSVPEEIQVWIFDEYQDCSALLHRVADRLSEIAGELYLLGDPYQAVYGFSGSDALILARADAQAKSNGNSLLLNRTWRNPESIVDWGESVLKEFDGYDDRMPFSEAGIGSTGMMHSKDLFAALPLLATHDTMILARAWFALRKIKDRLDELCIPWRSCQEKQSSRWECPAKIAFVLAMRDLTAGEKISEQDWRRITKELPQKMDGVELFTRGTKTKWAKTECSNENTTTLAELAKWGANDHFAEFLKQEKWRRDMMLLIDVAIEKYGINVVRYPRIQIGSCHSVKGLQAHNVFCLATSSKKSAEADPFEELCLKYVCITRASRNFRVVVDLYEHAQGKPLFLPCPRGYWTFEDALPDDLGEENSVRFPEESGDDSGGLGGEISGGDLRSDGNAGCSDLREQSFPVGRVQTTRSEIDETPTPDATENQECWWNL